ATPQWIPELPQANSQDLKDLTAYQPQQVKKVVYMPSCASRNMGQQADATDQRPLTEVTLSLLDKAG
ncbi:hypothetical protein, partial [Photobacterium sanctipauli]